MWRDGRLLQRQRGARLAWRLHGGCCVAFSDNAAYFMCVWWLQVHVVALDGFAVCSHKASSLLCSSCRFVLWCYWFAHGGATMVSRFVPNSCGGCSSPSRLEWWFHGGWRECITGAGIYGSAEVAERCCGGRDWWLLGFPREEARVENDDVARPNWFTCMCKD